MFIRFSKLSVYLTLAITALTLTACSSQPSTVMVGETRPAISADTVKLYLKEPSQYDTIALVSVSSDGSWSFGDQAQMDAVVQRLKEQAAKLGANGILLQTTGEKRDNSVYVGTGIGSYSGNVGLSVQLGRLFGLTDKTAEGVAIYVPDSASEKEHQEKQD